MSCFVVFSRSVWCHTCQQKARPSYLHSAIFWESHHMPKLGIKTLCGGNLMYVHMYLNIWCVRSLICIWSWWERKLAPQVPLSSTVLYLPHDLLGLPSLGLCRASHHRLILISCHLFNTSNAWYWSPGIELLDTLFYKYVHHSNIEK